MPCHAMPCICHKHRNQFLSVVFVLHHHRQISIARPRNSIFRAMLSLFFSLSGHPILLNWKTHTHARTHIFANISKALAYTLCHQKNISPMKYIASRLMSSCIDKSWKSVNILTLFKFFSNQVHSRWKQTKWDTCFVQVLLALFYVRSD